MPGHPDAEIHVRRIVAYVVGISQEFEGRYGGLSHDVPPVIDGTILDVNARHICIGQFRDWNHPISHLRLTAADQSQHQTGRCTNHG